MYKKGSNMSKEINFQEFYKYFVVSAINEDYMYDFETQTTIQYYDE